MKQYFTLISNDYKVDKNKLETAAKKATNEASHRIIPGSELKAFKQTFRDRIKELNKAFPRCKPLEVSTMNAHVSKADSIIWVENVCDLEFYLVKE